MPTLKKLLGILAITMLLFGPSFYGCGGTETTDGGSVADPTVPSDPFDPSDPADPPDPADPDVNSLMVGWTAPETNEDGSPLDDLAGYRLYYGRASRQYGNAVGVSKNYTEAEIDGLDDGTWFVAVTAYDYFGNESDYSNEINHTF